MKQERTLAIIKPNAVDTNHIGQILSRYEEEGLRIAAMKMVALTKERAEGFYSEHREKPFFRPLINFMTSAPVVLLVLEGPGAIERNRVIMGATNPEKAAPNTLRKLYGNDVTANAVHGSDCANSAEREIKFFFAKDELFERF